ncbi:hypothetical protein F1188_20540, partial [Roseospira marina]
MTTERRLFEPLKLTAGTLTVDAEGRLVIGPGEILTLPSDALVSGVAAGGQVYTRATPLRVPAGPMPQGAWDRGMYFVAPATGGRIDLVTAGVVQSAASFSRASAATLWDGAVVKAIAPDVPRVEGGALVIEPAATNTAYHSTAMDRLPVSQGTATEGASFGVGTQTLLTSDAVGTALLSRN